MRWRTAGTSSAGGRCSTGCSRARAGAPGAERDLRSHREVGAPRLHRQHEQGHAREDGARGVHRRHRPAVLAAFEGDGGGEGCPRAAGDERVGNRGTSPRCRRGSRRRGGGCRGRGAKGRRLERQGDAEGFFRRSPHRRGRRALRRPGCPRRAPFFGFLEVPQGLELGQGRRRLHHALFHLAGPGQERPRGYRAQLSRADPFYAMPKVNERAGT